MLVINELMAANVGEVMSPATNFDSWIEIYNPGDKDFDLGGLYLSDDAGNLTRWQIPSEVGSVPAKGFKVVWQVPTTSRTRRPLSNSTATAAPSSSATAAARFAVPTIRQP